MRIAAFALASVLLSGVAQAETITIHAGHLIAEPGKPVQAQKSILVENGKIVDVKDGYVPGEKIVDLKNAYVLPGLIDMHTHVTLALDIDSPNPTSAFMPAYIGRTAEHVLNTIPRLKQVLRTGFTTVRNLGDPSSITYDLRNAIARGTIEGPRILASEPQFNVSGGDYDAFAWGERRELEPYFKSRGTCDGPIDCRRAVREEIHRGADVIKLRLAAMPFLDPKVGSIEYADEIRAIVETAHKLNRKVAAHTSGSLEGNKLIIEAGVDTIEHGPIQDEAIALMKKHGTAYTPTLLAAKLAMPGFAKMGLTRDLYAEAVQSTTKAYKTGVPIVFGSDLAMMEPARVPEEFALLVAAGLTPQDALRAATINAATALGIADQIGTIERGKTADIVAVRADPTANISEMEKIFFVMGAGKIARDDR